MKKELLEYRKEVKKAIVTAIVSAFGFLIALTWRDYINSYIKLLSIQNEFLSVMSITLICVAGIFVTTKLFREKKQK